MHRKKPWLVPKRLRAAERFTMLNIVDAQWKDHLLAIDHLKKGHQPACGQKDPLIEYRKESFSLAEEMSDAVAAW
ncbi:MAG: hypothetical protein U0Y68_06175 [Blastocatellia bacterium]